VVEPDGLRRGVVGPLEVVTAVHLDQGPLVLRVPPPPDDPEDGPDWAPGSHVAVPPPAGVDYGGVNS